MHHNFHMFFRIHRMRKELKEIYANQIIDKFAHMMISIFIPVYLLSLGMGIKDAFIPVFIFNIVTLAMVLPTGIFSARTPLRRMILYRVPFDFIFAVMLIWMPVMGVNFHMLLLLGISWGLSHVFYWVPFNSEFVRYSNRKYETEQISFLFALPMMVSILAPFFGGFVYGFGKQMLILTFMLLMLASLIPLVWIKEKKKSIAVRMRSVFVRMGRDLELGTLAVGALTVAEFMMWPFYIHTMFMNPLTTGLSGSISVIGLVFFTLLTGRMAGRLGKERVMKVGAFGYFFVWIIRMFVHSFMEVMMISFLGGLFLTLIKISFFTCFCDRAKQGNIINSVSVREMWLFIGRAIVIGVFVFSTISFQWLFVLLALIAGMCFWLKL